mgnify:FL=1|jgi:hypothetical protein
MRDLKDLMDCYRHVFSTPEGEIVLQDILDHAYISMPTVEEASDSPSLVMFREGARNLALYILLRANKKLGVVDG